MAGESGRVEAFAAWRRFFEAMAEERPTVLVFEDIQWADAAMLDFVDLLADRAGALPLLIVCTARPELLEQRPSWGGGKTNAMTISLSPLSADNTARLIGELLDQSVLPAEVQQGLLARAEGNPLYAQEYVRMLQDRGLLVPEGRSWTLTGAVDGLPESIHGIIAARLDTLTPAEKALMQDASVVGKTAWVGAVCSLSDRSPREAEELVHALERRQLVHRMRRSTIQGEIEFTFGHALTRDVAYSQIRRADRATKHEAAAMWIERLAGDRDDKAELLADHYQQALQLLEQLGEDTSVLAPRARAAFVEAAKQAAATYAYPAAARHYRAALRLTPADSMADNAALLMGEAVALFNAGRADGKVLQAAVDAQVAVGEWRAAAQAEQMLSRWYQEDAASAEDADVHLDRAAEYAARVPPSDVTFLIAYDQAFRLMTTGDGKAAHRLTSEMIPLAEQAGVDGRQGDDDDLSRQHPRRARRCGRRRGDARGCGGACRPCLSSHAGRVWQPGRDALRSRRSSGCCDGDGGRAGVGATARNVERYQLADVQPSLPRLPRGRLAGGGSSARDGPAFQSVR